MTELVSLFFSSLIIAFSGAMMPGPLFVATVNAGMKRGPIAGPILMLGHAILEILLIASIWFGLAPIIKQPSVFTGISLVGGLALVWMAFSMFRSLPGLKLDFSGGRKQTGHKLIGTGIVMSLSNPYWSMWWATIGLSYLLRFRHLGLAGVAAFFIGHISGDLIWYSAVSWSSARSRKFLSDRTYRIIIGFCATLLVGFGFIFIWGAAQRLRVH
jgi:threonine/homoserine/homoserine lactone efflux protein